MSEGGPLLMMEQKLKTSGASNQACDISPEFSRRLPPAQAMTSTPQTEDEEGEEPITSVPFIGRANLSQQYITQPDSPRIYEKWDLCEGYRENGKPDCCDWLRPRNDSFLVRSNTTPDEMEFH